MQVLNRLVAIVEAATAQDDGIGLADAARATGLAPATTHRLLSALQEAHLLERGLDDRRYRPGVALLRLAASLRHGERSAADVALLALRDRWQQCFYLTELIDDDIVSVQSVITTDPHRMSVSVPVGRRMGPHASASGKATLAALPLAERWPILDACGGLYPLTEHTLKRQADLDRDLATVADCGYAVCDQETELGVAAVAVAFRPEDGTCRSLGAIGPRERILEALDQGLAEDLIAAGRYLSGQLHDAHTAGQELASW
ncbi:MAG: hypothetical protein JWO02_1509 [Solirubrobacterales bacterium]|nr:hypothetical protein [Solirubrobacterales bacterium]